MSENEIDFEFENNDLYGSDVEENDDLSILAQNLFYEAEYECESNPGLAIQKFLRISELEPQDESGGNKSSFFWVIKSYINVVLLCAKHQIHEQLMQTYPKLLKLLPRVTWNEALEAIGSVIDAVSENCSTSDFFYYPTKSQSKIVKSSSSVDYFKNIYLMTLESLEGYGYKTLWFNTCVNLAKLYVSQGDVDGLRSCLKKLHKFCEEESLAKRALQPKDFAPTLLNARLFELYALESQLCLLTDDLEKMREIYPKTLQLAAVVADPHTVAAVRHSGGQMFMADKKWEMAYTEFFEAFKNYLLEGNTKNARCMLKLVAIANLLYSSSVDPFLSNETAVFLDDPEIVAFKELRIAVDQQDNEKVVMLLTNSKSPIFCDAYVQYYLSDLLFNIRLQLLKKNLLCYETVSLVDLATYLSVSIDETQCLLFKLITENQINAEIDDIEGIVYVLESIQNFKQPSNHNGVINFSISNNFLLNLNILNQCIISITKNFGKLFVKFLD